MAVQTGINGAGVPWRPRAQSGPTFPERTLHLIDVENLTGHPIPSQAQVSELQDLYATRIGLGAVDQTVIACNHLALANVGCGWTGARYLVRSGPDGADLELLSVITYENLAQRFSQVIIGSGDGIFAWAAAGLAAADCHVTVVSRQGSLSKRLALAAHRVIYIDALDSAAGNTATFRPDAA